MAKGKVFLGFDFADEHRGLFARLRGGRHEVILCEWPGSLLSMLRADALAGRAKEDALALVLEDRRDPKSGARKRGQDALYL